MEAAHGGGLDVARPQGQEMKVVITQDDDRRFAQATDIAQDTQGIGATIDEVANQP